MDLALLNSSIQNAGLNNTAIRWKQDGGSVTIVELNRNLPTLTLIVPTYLYKYQMFQSISQWVPFAVFIVNLANASNVPM